MSDKLEMDQTILKKNLEITKLTKQIDSLLTKNVSLRDMLKISESTVNKLMSAEYAIKKLEAKLGVL